MEADREVLTSAVIAIANASRTAVELTAYKVAEKVARDTKNIMRDRLSTIFGATALSNDFKIRGASHDEWEFDAAVNKGGVITLFETISPHPNSVAAAVTKFVDLGDLRNGPRLVGVLADPKVTPHRRLVERSARTIGLEAETKTWLHAVAA